MNRSPVVSALVAAFALVACQKKEEAAPMMEPSAAPGIVEKAEYGAAGEMADRMAAPGTPGMPAPTLGAPQPDRQFVRSADLRLRTRSVESATRSIQAIVVRNGGFVEVDDLRSVVDEQRSSPLGNDSQVVFSRVAVANEMVLRVPNDRLDTVLAGIEPLVSFLDHRTVRAQDVGMELRRAARERRRLENAGRRVADLIDQSTGRLRDKTSAEDLVLQREDRAEAEAARVDDLQAQVALSTIRVELYQHPDSRMDTLALPLFMVWREPFLQRFARSWTDGWDGFIDLALWIVAHWIWILLSATLVVLLMRRRRSKSAG